MPDSADRNDAVTRSSTRGVAAIGSAKIYFLLLGFVQPIVLTRIFGKSDYGLYNSVVNIVSIVNNVVVSGSIQAMSREVTESGTRALRRGIILHALLGAAVCVSLVALSNFIGVTQLRDTQVPGLLRIGAIISANYSVYAALVGAINGQQRFTTQAALDMTFATLRTALIIGLALTAWRVRGALTGFAIGSAIITLVAFVVVWPRGDSGTKARDESFGTFALRYATFCAPVLLYQLALNLVLQSDLLVLKALLGRRAGLDTPHVNDVVALYKAAQAFAILPYQLLIAVTFVVFPVVSRTTLEGDRETTRRFVQNALRLSLLALGAMLSVLVGLPLGVLRVAYPADFAAGADALRILSVGQGAFALGVIASTIILAAGRTRAATSLMALMLSAVLVGDVIGIESSKTPIAALAGTAGGTTIGCILGLVAIALYMRRSFGAFIPTMTALRATLATLTAATAVALVPMHGKIVTLGLAVVAVVIYVTVLAVAGEIGPDERKAIARLGARLRRRAP